jgi:hypothetical protein
MESLEFFVILEREEDARWRRRGEKKVGFLIWH